MCKPRILLVLTLAVMTALPTAGKSWLGGVYSPKGVGVSSLMATFGRSSYLKAELVADLAGVLRGWGDVPGIQARFSHLYTLVRTELPTGTSLKFQSGPGTMFGYVCDQEGNHGMTACLCGEAGLFFDFQKKVAVGLFFSADVGLHHQRKGSADLVKFYLNGVLRAYYPELRLLYRF